jgi:prepilin-type N-terminal cleavage/methylation domain-containing protein/prepilin-type processing-associated H-X9-DG protein
MVEVRAMRHEPYRKIHSKKRNGFTLIELLIVVAIIALLLAILVPALSGVKRIARSVYCRGNLRQVGTAINMYLDENKEYFYQKVNANHHYIGWRGYGGHDGGKRPVNPYLGLSSDMIQVAENDAKIARCPSDTGGIHNRPPELRAYQYFGNCYQSNIMLVGPDELPDEQNVLHQEINKHLKRLKRSAVYQPERTLFAGDSNWVNEWVPGKPFMETWHGEKHKYNVVFLDGHVKYQRIRKGLYVNNRKDGDYLVMPFESLIGLAMQQQQEIIPPEEIPEDNP